MATFKNKIFLLKVSTIGINCKYVNFKGYAIGKIGWYW